VGEPFAAFALVEGPGGAVGFDAGQGGHVEDVAQAAVVALWPAQVAGDPLGVLGHGYQPGVGGQEVAGGGEGGQAAAGGDEEFGAQVTDADFAAARAAGFTEDELFELVICAAVGQSGRLYDAGLAALADAVAVAGAEDG
jgi:hypothetical protein